ncbi:hypothetical protein [Chitinophaga pinensis]|uniref:Uncharacterized protein n=1 Tax=Chitinophaga pinensis TaxID=79329 RepID=A0A5C6LUD2_9BACT|nr:hypothetical protein [Chitinophaga pinensis]TWW00090.1 hypothetical protein FEF09_12120 [Chitinophaga pinensis]
MQDPRAIRNNWQLAQSRSLRQGEPLRLEFFPEGNVLIAGIANTVAFKALNKDNEPVDLKGQLYKDGKPVSAVETQHGGMGIIRFTPEADGAYVLRHEGKDFKLPPIAKDGIGLHLVRNQGDSLLFKLSSPRPKEQQVLLRIQVRGAVQVIAAGVLKDSLLMKIPIAELPSGVAEVTLFNEQQGILASRWYMCIMIRSSMCASAN